MKLSKTQANLVLTLTAIIWGSGYIFTKLATNAHMPAGMINGFRGLIYAVLVYIFFGKVIRHMTRTEFKIGLIAGIINLVAYQLQTVSLQYTTPGDNAFLTATYVVIIPFIMWLVFHETPAPKSYLAIIICMLGVMELTGIFNHGFNFQLGDILVILSAVFYAIQIVYFGSTAASINPWITAFMLGLVQGLGGFIWSGVFEHSAYGAINWQAALLPVFILGVLSSFGAQSLQLIGQKFTDPTPAGLIMMTESVFGSIFSVAFGFEAFTINLLLGGLLILLAIILMQVDFRKLYVARQRRRE
ncbi:MAG: DMT family transporter [Lacticaseibacillus songhuajiangensis]|jgi:drug/metabolite transporter (DMT)-like permease|nr:DMT family transporter [Lacticaseibacillus songhuajiangensis]